MQVTPAISQQEIETVQHLFREYQAELGIDLCFQSFEEELATLPGRYASPDGRLFLASANGSFIGCVGLRRLEDGICELKRLFVRPEARSTGAGRELTLTAIRAAKDAGYRKMRLDTLPQMGRAINLYRTLGFREIEPYTRNPVAGALFLELDLADVLGLA